MPVSKKRKKPMMTEKEITEHKIDTITAVVYATMLSLGDEYGFGKVRLKRYNERLKGNLKALRDKRISVKDMGEVLRDEYGMDLDEIFRL